MCMDDRNACDELASDSLVALGVMALIMLIVSMLGCAAVRAETTSEASSANATDGPPVLDNCNLIGIVVAADCVGQTVANQQEANVCILVEALTVKTCRSGDLTSLVDPNSSCTTHQRLVAAIVSTVCEKIGINIECPEFVNKAVVRAHTRCAQPDREVGL
jgi:hypothetical protein